MPTVSNKRPLCSKAMEASLPDTKEYRRATYKMNRGFLGRFWDWLHTDLEQDTYVRSKHFSCYCCCCYCCCYYYNGTSKQITYSDQPFCPGCPLFRGSKCINNSYGKYLGP